ncbi:MAG: KTSC domain-containing protein [Chloroflexota bacterium]|nr:KTSC domain-containing protein [Chloroflexota bacterium]
MATSTASSSTVSGLDSLDLDRVYASFQSAVVDSFRKGPHTYQTYLTDPTVNHSGDEADVVDQVFTEDALKWLGFTRADWNYNLPQKGQKERRPDYLVRGTIGTAFIWEDKNSGSSLEADHLQQMRRYSVGTAGYAVWCNMSRLLAVRFISTDTLRYETLADINVAGLAGVTPLSAAERTTQLTNLALFQLLFSKERFTQFTALTGKIAVNEATFLRSPVLDSPLALENFISGSRQTLDHLRLAATAQIREALTTQESTNQRRQTLYAEWRTARTILTGGLLSNTALLEEALDQLRPGESEIADLQQVETALAQALAATRLSGAQRTNFENWLERAQVINTVLRADRFQVASSLRVAEAYRIWSSRQTDPEDVQPELFAEQVAYVFFVRMLLVRILEDKSVIQPRIASNGGFLEWRDYVQRHFQELEGIGILHDNYTSLLTRKAGHYYLHFFQQPVFDWFDPDDYLLVETLEFLCRYNFGQISSDVIGFTYEEYINRRARKRKGHFLTRDEVVNYMLDVLDYQGSQVIGRRILDPASGSGSFLVHAARRYRKALVTALCTQHNLSNDETALSPELRVELAHRYIQDLTSLFHGMEINPFACYLAEMNLLIQALDDVVVLQHANIQEPIERFHIYNTDSLLLPREVLIAPPGGRALLPGLDRLSDRLADDAYPIKAKLNGYNTGFFYIISNPPYVTSKQETLDLERLLSTPFYSQALSGDTNLYLLFLRLGLYYLAPLGQMVYIMPLTLFGDISARATRALLRTAPFVPTAAIRFYRGDVLFPDVDQAVGIIRIHNNPAPATAPAKMLVSGGLTIAEARSNEYQAPIVDVVAAVPSTPIWQGSWLVASNATSVSIWQTAQAAQVPTPDGPSQLGYLLDSTFQRKQGDVNATYVNPLRRSQITSTPPVIGDVALYKGEDVFAYAPLPATPSDWAAPLSANALSSPNSKTVQVSNILKQLQQVQGIEQGIVLREVARLNTRERLIATWFDRDASHPLAFTHETWRMVLRSGRSVQRGQAILALLNSRITAYLINLFSTNNHVGKNELSRIPIPDPQTFPEVILAQHAADLLRERQHLETAFVEQLQAVLPEFDSGNVYIPPSLVLAISNVPNLSLQDLMSRGLIRNQGSATASIKALLKRSLITNTLQTADPQSIPFGELLTLFLQEPAIYEQTWQQVQHWQLPDPVAATMWLQQYKALDQQAQVSWQNFVQLQMQVDTQVANWYGFTATQQNEVTQGLPWVQRPQSASPSSRQSSVPAGATNRVPVASGTIYQIGYDPTQELLEVEFANGTVIQYQPVPIAVYQDFTAAASKGRYYSSKIRGHYPGQTL